MGLKERGAITGNGETAYSRNSGKSVVAHLRTDEGGLDPAGVRPDPVSGAIAVREIVIEEVLCPPASATSPS